MSLRRSVRGRGIGLVVVLSAMCVPREAHAQLVDFQPVLNAISTVNGLARAARDNALDARDRAVEARDRAAEARDVAAQIKLVADELRTNMQAGASTLTDELRDLIEQAADEARRILAEEAEGREAFLPGGQCATACTAFREDLIGLLTDTQALAVAVANTAGLDVEPNLGPVITTIGAAPGRTLYPLSRLLQGVLASGVRDRFAAGVADIQTLRGTVLDRTSSLSDVCAATAARPAAVEGALRAATGLGAVVKLVAMGFKIAGRTEFEGYAAGWGWVGGTIKGNKPMKVADVLGGVADGLFTLSTYGHNKLRYCATLAFQAETRAALTSLAATVAGLDIDVSHVDVPISSRATQASVDGLSSSLQGLQTDVSTLIADRNSVSPSLMLRIQIERQLADRSSAAMAVFYLPESLGGLLHKVRSVVEESITQQGVAGDLAWQFFWQGDAALARAEYRAAYSAYQKAYLHLGGGRP